MARENVGTTIGTNVKLTGTLQDANDIAIYGRVEGEVVSASNVLIGETAMIKGPIQAKVVTITGKVKGSIHAAEKLEIMEGGHVYGSIATADLIIHSKAVFIGKSEMTEQQGSEDVEEATQPTEESAPEEK